MIIDGRLIAQRPEHDRAAEQLVGVAVALQESPGHALIALLLYAGNV
jgi:hypothetical protein